VSTPVKVPPIYAFCRGICRIVSSVWFDLKAYGVENIPRQGGVLLVSNHESYLDPIVVGVQVPRAMSFMAKSELFKPIGFGWLIHRLGAFPVHQGRGDRGAIDETIERLQQGHILNIFPEGERSATGELGPIKKGVALIAKRANVPVVPVIVEGSFEAWPKNKAMPQSHPIRVLYGPPIDVSNLRGDEIVKTIHAKFRQMRDELAAKVAGEQPYLL
jgi:1-acyl-sn-glycerol-3-phosphate acyltransferase